MSREPLSRERIAELRALLEKATPGLWYATTFDYETIGEMVNRLRERVEHNSDSLSATYLRADKPNVEVCFAGNGPTQLANSAFIAALRNEAESLLAAAERGAALEGLLREAHDYMERKGVAMNLGVEGAGIMERIEAALRAENGGGE